LKKFLAVTIVVLAALPMASSAQASTAGQREALEAAKSYLRSGHFSKAGLIEQLESPYGEDFSHSDARWAVAHVQAQLVCRGGRGGQVISAVGAFFPPEPHRAA
jgi:Host cell surface-exposed lipoprotein